MNTYLFTLITFLTLVTTNIWCTTIINGSGKQITVTVFYNDGGCKANSATLKSGESLYVNQTCRRERIEVVEPNGYSEIIAAGGYNEDGEILTFRGSKQPAL
jgi:hypothetical protein